MPSPTSQALSPNTCGFGQSPAMALLLVVPGFTNTFAWPSCPHRLFAKRYRAGQVDALELSHQLTHGRVLTLTLVMIAPLWCRPSLITPPAQWPLLHALPIRLLFTG